MSPLSLSEKSAMQNARKKLNGFAAALFIEYGAVMLVTFLGAVVAELCGWGMNAFLTSAYTDAFVRILSVIPFAVYAKINLSNTVSCAVRKIRTPMPLVFAAICFASVLARIPGMMLFGNDANIERGMTYSGMEMWAFLFSVCIAAPITEEYMFRSVLLRAMRPLGRNAYLLISSLLFASLHARGSMLSAFVIALAFGYIAYETGGMRYTTALHMLSNFVSCVVMLAEMTENEKLLSAVSLGYSALIFLVGIPGLIVCIMNLKKSGSLSVRFLPVRYGFTIPIILFLAYKIVSTVVSIWIGG